jgi:hypothetical protein
VTSNSKTSQFFKRWNPAFLTMLFLLAVAFNWLVFGPGFFDSIDYLNPLVLFAVAMDALVISVVYGMVQDLRRLSRGEPLPEITQKARDHAEALNRAGAAYARSGADSPFQPPLRAHPQPAEEQPGVSEPPASPIPSTGSVSGIFRKMQMQSANFLRWIVGLSVGGFLLIGLTQFVSGPSSGWNGTAIAGTHFFTIGVVIGVWGLFITIGVLLLDAVLSIVKIIRSAPPDSEANERSASLRSNIIPTTEPGPNVFQRIFLLGELACLIFLAIGVTLMALSHVGYALRYIIGSR